MTKTSNQQKPGLGESLVNSAGSTNLSEINAEVLDIALDAFLEDGVMKDITIFGWLFKAARTGASIRDAIFLRKVFKFLKGASCASTEGKENFTQKIETDDDYGRRVGENLLLLIDRHERVEKSFLLGRLFAAYMKDEITHEVFLRLAAALDKSVLEDLEELQKHSPHYFMISESAEEGLYRSGLMEIKIEVPELNSRISGLGVKMKAEYEYKMNKLGKMFVKHAFEPAEKT